jgi:hypothetical protein
MRERAKKLLRAVRAIPLHQRLSKVSDFSELAGIGCVVGAVWWWLPILGLASLGVALFYIGWVTHEPS